MCFLYFVAFTPGWFGIRRNGASVIGSKQQHGNMPSHSSCLFSASVPRPPSRGDRGAVLLLERSGGSERRHLLPRHEQRQRQQSWHSAAPWKTLTKVQADATDGDMIVIQQADAATYAAKWPAQVSYKAKVLQQFAVTWTFDTEYTVGQFNTGDFWVVGPVKIIGIDPLSAPVDGRTMNGSMVNPRGGWNPQGYDSAMVSNPYDSALNVALGVSGSKPLTLSPNSSLISTISATQAGSLPQLRRAVILTVLGFAAAPGSFRPPYCGTDKTIRFNKSALDYSRLQKLTPVIGTPALSEVEAQFSAPWIEHQGGWTATALRPSLNMPNYGRDMHAAIGVAALMLHLNFTDAQKEKLLVEFVQLGIDLYGVLVNGAHRTGRRTGAKPVDASGRFSFRA